MSSSSTVELEARAKLNLFLEVLGRRGDGYHEIDSVFAEIDWSDTVRLERASRISLTVEGGAAPPGRSNLAWRAAEALGVGARIHLVKRLPAGAGLGGGSSDAAAVLRGLARLYRIETDLAPIAARLGADVPFFLAGGTARCTGIGDVVSQVRGGSGRRFLVLAPALESATADVYREQGAGLIGKRESATVFLHSYLEAGPARFFNRLQAAAEGIDARLREVREQGERMYGAAFTMTGSGSSYFAEVGGFAVAGGRVAVDGDRTGFVTGSGVDVVVREVTTI